MKFQIIEHLQYYVLPARFKPGFEFTALYNRAFSFWHQFWLEVLAENNSPSKLDAHAFLGADLIGLLMSGDQIVSVYVHSVFNLQQQNVDYHPYFNGEGEGVFLNELRSREMNSAMSIELFAVDKKFRKSEIGFSLIPIFGGLAYELQNALEIDACLGRCRQEVRMTSLFMDRGGVALQRDIMMHNTLTDFCAVFRNEIQPHADRFVTEAVHRLWANRIDGSGLTNSNERFTQVITELKSA